MLTLYRKNGCPYCAKVLTAASELGITFIDKNIADPEVVDELIALGGKRQVPFLVDDARGVSLYESADIIEYLRAHHTPSEA